MKPKNIIIILLICCILAVIASVIASSHPDGLEWVAEQTGFLEAGEGKDIISAPMPDYIIPFIKNGFMSAALAGIAGTIAVFAVVFLIGKIVGRQRRKQI